jgi:hypothetical protein
MTPLKHFDYTPDQADVHVRFELRNPEPNDDGEARVALTVVDLEGSSKTSKGRSRSSYVLRGPPVLQEVSEGSQPQVQVLLGEPELLAQLRHLGRPRP